MQPVGLVAGLRANGAIGTQEESAVFRRNVRVFRVLRHFGHKGVTHQGGQAKDMVFFTLELKCSALRSSSPDLFYDL